MTNPATRTTEAHEAAEVKRGEALAERMMMDAAAITPAATSLHVWTNGNDSVIAESKEEALALLIKEVGPDDGENQKIENWSVTPDDKRIGINFTDGPAGHRESYTAAEWCALNGKGYLCSQEH